MVICPIHHRCDAKAATEGWRGVGGFRHWVTISRKSGGSRGACTERVCGLLQCAQCTGALPSAPNQWAWWLVAVSSASGCCCSLSRAGCKYACADLTDYPVRLFSTDAGHGVPRQPNKTRTVNHAKNSHPFCFVCPLGGCFG